MKPHVPKLHVITDTTLQSRHTHAELAQLAIDGGADGIQFRQKDGSTRDLLRQAEATRNVCAKGGATFIVNDRLDVAMAVDADGVHVGQDDMPAREARRLWGWDKIVGATAFTPTMALQALSDGADYVGFGPLYGTQSKANARPATGVEGLRRFAAGCGLPIIAIGSVKAVNVPELLDAGAYGVAVISAVCLADDIPRAVAEFVAALR
ncbi:MAG: thiamine phosphate synthase [Candidatus Poribacteria bacterium]|nr:thiamine phosphate synthase [Candidatus Poribacteria bacterium]